MSQCVRSGSCCTHGQNHNRSTAVVNESRTSQFDSIAAEIFLKVVENLNTARDVASLSRVCKRFQVLVDRDGWRIFVQTKFPSLATALPPGIENHPAEWRDLARSLTTQSRAWDRRAIYCTEKNARNQETSRWLAHALEAGLQIRGTIPKKDKDFVSCLVRWDKASGGPPEGIANDEHGDTQPPFQGPQTAHFHPAIDSRLEFSGTLSSKKHTVVWSTGHEVVVQVRRSGSYLPRPEDNRHDRSLDHNSNGISFFKAYQGEFRPGLDDVTSLNIVDSSLQLEDCPANIPSVDFIAGRASGRIHRFSVSSTDRLLINTFHSASRRSLRSADVNGKSGAFLLAACSDQVVSLYNIEAEAHDVLPLDEFKFKQDLPRAQAWAARFSSSENLLLGLGRSTWHLHAYKVTPSGLTLTEKLGDQPDESSSVPSSVYALEPLSGASRAGRSCNGEVFLAGCYDGVCRLYDRRAGPSSVRSFRDPVNNDFAIYSLATFGQERFLAGSGNSILRIFDLRNGAKVYHYADGLPCSAKPPLPEITCGMARGPKGTFKITSSQMAGNERVNRCHHDLYKSAAQTCTFHKLSRMDLCRPNTSLFVYGLSHPPCEHSGRRSFTGRSPIFSLSSPDPICPVFYAGTSGAVYEFEMSELSGSGHVPDPYFAAPPGAAERWWSQDLAMYEMENSDFTALNNSGLPATLWRMSGGYYVGNSEWDKNRGRLDTRWHATMRNGGAVLRESS